MSRKADLLLIISVSLLPGVVLPESPPSAGGGDEREGLVGGQPGAGRASAPRSRDQLQRGKQLVGRPRRPGVRSTGVAATDQPGPAEGRFPPQHQYTPH